LLQESHIALHSWPEINYLAIDIFTCGEKVFPFFRVHKAFVGCFPFNEHTFSFGSKKIDFDKVIFEEINKKFKKLKIKTRYYSPEIHFASAIFPPI